MTSNADFRDITWHFPGRSPFAGHHQGADEVAGFFRKLGEQSGGTHRIELHDVIANDDHAVALHATRAERAGKQLQINAVQVFHIRDWPSKLKYGEVKIPVSSCRFPRSSFVLVRDYLVVTRRNR